MTVAPIVRQPYSNCPDLWHTRKMPYWFDGNNLIGQSVEAARADRKTRQAFLSLLSTRTFGRKNRFIVFFDGEDPDRSSPPHGINVRYSAPISSDDAILSGIRGSRSPSDIIVVTNDNALRRDAGMLARRRRTGRHSCL